MTTKQALIVGLGQFGMALARTLSERGVEVLAVDRDKNLVQAAANFVAEAACFDAADEESLHRAGPSRRDLCVCAIGNEARESAIIVTALLRQMGAPRIVARATDDLTERILSLVGAHQIVNPERAFGERLAKRLLYRDIVEELPLGPELTITEIRPPAVMVGRSLTELALLERHGVSVVAVRRVGMGPDAAIKPDLQRPLAGDDILVVVSGPEAVRVMLEKI
ncbi:MAG: TrkA family potassium uptake protein [Myxococcales bacterium]|nr:TrkA family potassium uptake protein [Myxococcales bacterium]